MNKRIERQFSTQPAATSRCTLLPPPLCIIVVNHTPLNLPRVTHQQQPPGRITNTAMEEAAAPKAKEAAAPAKEEEAATTMEERQRQQRPRPKQDDNQDDKRDDKQDDNQDDNQDDKTRRPHPGGLTTRLPPGRASTSPPARRSAQPPHPLAGLGPRPAPVSLLSIPPADLIWPLYVPGSLFCPPSLRTLLPLPRVHDPRGSLPAAAPHLASVPPSAAAPTTPTVERCDGPSGHGRPVVDEQDGFGLDDER